jgi:Ca2+:H+ antiporter
VAELTVEATVANEQKPGWTRHLRREFMLLVSAVTAVFFLVLDRLPPHDGYGWLAGEFLWLFAVVLLASLAAVRHAEALSQALGEPFGTLILTAAVTSIEVTLISSIMLGGENNPTLARDTMFAAMMLVLNGLVGLGLLVGGWRFKELHHNLQGANAYLVVIIPLASIGFILPDFTVSTPQPTLSNVQSTFVILVSLAVYGIFLTIQTTRHKSYFTSPVDTPVEGNEPHAQSSESSTLFHGVLLVLYLIAVIVLAERLSRPIDSGIERLGAPAALGGLVVASLVLFPEGINGLRSALNDDLQRAVNILLGSILATISLTIPAVLLVGMLTDREIVLGLNSTDSVLLLVTMLVSLTTFSTARTNVLHGAVHLLLFLVYVVLIFDP